MHRRLNHGETNSVWACSGRGCGMPTAYSCPPEFTRGPNIDVQQCSEHVNSSSEAVFCIWMFLTQREWITSPRVQSVVNIKKLEVLYQRTTGGVDYFTCAEAEGKNKMKNTYYSHTAAVSKSDTWGGSPPLKQCWDQRQETSRCLLGRALALHE